MDGSCREGRGWEGRGVLGEERNERREERNGRGDKVAAGREGESGPADITHNSASSR